MNIKLKKKFKIIAYVITALVLLTALLSAYSFIFSFVVGAAIPEMLSSLLGVLNFFIPCMGIATMCTFIFLREKQRNKKNG